VPAGSRGAPPLLVHSAQATRLLPDGSQTTYTVGRNDKGDFELADPRISWEHALLRAEGSQWVLEDLNSRNGTFADSAKVTRLEITAPVVVHFGQPADGPFLRFEPLSPDAAPAVAANGDAANAERLSLRPSVDTNPTTRTQISDQVISIGRRPDNDIIVSDLAVSKVHAQLRKTPTGAYMIIDAGSHNGTFVNGVRVHKADLSEEDLVSIGHSTFRLSGGVLTQYNDEGRAPFAAQDLAVSVADGRKRKTILAGITFPLAERSMMAVLGPAGAGKSTLLNALTGKSPATAGTVLYDNRDLYQSYEELRHRIGLVPQDSITHDALTAREALSYAAELRFSPDVSADDRRHRVAAVLEELEMTQHAGTPIKRLSGGQKKRVNIGLELLTQPSLLFLDEPTSPLDPHLKRQMFQQLRAMANKDAADGQSVVVITHDVDASLLGLCDRLLVLAPGGHMAYFGPPREALKFFDKADWADVFQAFSDHPETDWAAEFQTSRDYLKYVAMPMAPRLRQPPPAAPEAEALRGRRRGLLTQALIMSRRQFRVIASDRVYLTLAGGFPVILGLMFLLMLKSSDAMGLYGAPGNLNKSDIQPLLILILAAALSGAVNSIGEIVKERDIFQRERMAGISPGAYLLSKIWVLGLVSIVQALIIVVLGLSLTRMPLNGSVITSFPFAELAIAVLVTCVVSMLLGLLISSLATSAEQTFPILVVATLLQVVFTGAATPLKGAMIYLSDPFPARWGLAMLGSTVNLNQDSVPLAPNPDKLWDHTSGQWLFDLAILLALGLLMVLFTYRRLAATGARPRRRKQPA
jgi:ABC transport system ATP-binding/permease protein